MIKRLYLAKMVCDNSSNAFDQKVIGAEMASGETLAYGDMLKIPNSDTVIIYEQS
jgi:hypothetical protein